jgi:hypothetical protein
MARFLKTVLHQDVSLAAGATPLEKDLGVNPLSHLTMTLRFLNNGERRSSLANPLPCHQRRSAQGNQYLQRPAVDMVALAAFLWGFPPPTAQGGTTISSTSRAGSFTRALRRWSASATPHIRPKAYARGRLHRLHFTLKSADRTL